MDEVHGVFSNNNEANPGCSEVWLATVRLEQENEECDCSGVYFNGQDGRRYASPMCELNQLSYNHSRENYLQLWKNYKKLS